jgi:CRP-like cAMP-binding protein
MAARSSIFASSATVPQSVSATKSRKRPGKVSVPSPPLEAAEAALLPLYVDVSQKQTTAFDPHLLLTKLATGKTSQEYLADESVFSQGDAADAVFYIQSGKEAVVAILPEGSFFGEACLAGQQIRMSTASAVERSLIIRVEKRAMVALLHEELEFAEGFLTYLLSRNVRMEADLVNHLFNSSEKRLARLLVLMANFGHATHCENESGDPRRDGRNHPLQSQLLHEWVPGDGFH